MKRMNFFWKKVFLTLVEVFLYQKNLDLNPISANKGMSLIFTEFLFDPYLEQYQKN